MKRQAHNWYLDFCIHPSFEGVNTLFVWSSENEDDWKSYKRYYLPIREIKHYNQCYDRWKIFLINQQKQEWKMVDILSSAIGDSNYETNFHTNYC